MEYDHTCIIDKWMEIGFILIDILKPIYSWIMLFSKITTQIRIFHSKKITDNQLHGKLLKNNLHFNGKSPIP